VQFQSIIGFGGAFTDATTISLATLPADLQQHVLQAYFGSNGAVRYSILYQIFFHIIQVCCIQQQRYSVGRVPVGGCDFSTHSYSYIKDGDYDLTSFALADEDTSSGGKIDVIHRAQIQSVHPIKLFASVWSAPPFLKVNTTSYIGGTLDPAPRAQTAWARYLSRFISEYEKRGVSFWGLTMQNEPTPLPAFLEQKWDSMFFSPEQSLEFIRDYFGPILRQDHPDVKLMIHDDQALFLMALLKTVLSDPKVLPYIDGVAVHWYLEIVY
jgi:glucosylceramidase